ncbi:MAG: alpha-amylase family glycosyl hydrolase [bacterium]
MIKRSGPLVVGLGLALLLALSAVGLAAAAQVTFVHRAPGAGSVFLAGSFNNWSDSQTALTDDDGDGIWAGALELADGEHLYKFVVDGSWRHDETNPNTADDGFGGFNSVLTVSGDDAVSIGGGELPMDPVPPAVVLGDGLIQVTFVYSPDQASDQIFLAGEFNGWNAAGEKMSDPDGDGIYAVTVPLVPGRYMYKFVVDGVWFQDPGNPEAVDDGYGGQNSVIEVPAGIEALDVGADLPAGAVLVAMSTTTPAETPETAAELEPGQVAVSFAYTPGAGAASVNLAGEFNSWSPNAEPMSDDDGDGTYTVTIGLSPGQYPYKFVVDGAWFQDPSNPQGVDDGFGGQNSVVEVPAGSEAMTAASGGGGGTTAEETGPVVDAGAGLRTVEFTYTPVISGVSNVFLAGTFNDWNDSHTRMIDADEDGTYSVTLLLSPGNYQYKFVVDGQWQQDPANPLGADDGFGGQNSVLKVDASFPTVDIELGDDRVYTDDIEPTFDYSTCNPLSRTEIEIMAKAHLDDVEEVALLFQINDGELLELVMTPRESDPAFQYYRARVELADDDDTLDYVIRYRDGATAVYLGATGAAAKLPDNPFRYRAADFPPFLTPEWAKDGIIYQIFPERFRNGNTRNDPDFGEPWYEGANELPASGQTNGEYFHLVGDWYDITGLVKSPYRTDNLPDYYSFYGGDIAGIREKLDYLNDLGITVIYFNPLNQGMSNHKYDPVDYLKIDPHFASEQEFVDFVADAHAHGIRIVVDMAFNHTGNWHFAFRDAVEKGPDSFYYKWYEFKRWPLPASRDIQNASDYYDCWWGFGLHPNLNFDLQRANADENGLDDMADAAVNQAVVDYVLSVADKWLGFYDIDGFRLDVPNEVPFWFWKLFNERCKSIKPDCYLVGELWGNAGRWIGPHCFDATMNYKFFRDPVMDFFGKGIIDAAAFDQRLAPGRFQYPPQSVAVMMNLIDSHDTIRFLTTTKDVRRLMLAAMFSMCYVGMPTIWYGDEIGMEGGKDPDCRRPFEWRYEDNPRQVELRDYYGAITRFRRDNEVLRRGDFSSLIMQGQAYGFARTLGERAVLALFNAGTTPVEVNLDSDRIAALLPEGASSQFTVVVGSDSFPQESDGDLTSGATLDLGAAAVTVTIPAKSGALLAN